ncbi:MAG: UDP-N-acetylglucosamine 2-epimerase [Phycisphaerales bacterium]
MIGDGWDGDPAARPGAEEAMTPGRRRVTVVTGTRAEFGLLAPVMRAVRDRADLELVVIAAGSHLLSPALTYREVKAEFVGHLGDQVPMQLDGHVGRAADVEALGRGVARFGRSFERLSPDWVVVLGDRIEAFAAASAAAVGGRALAHIHGGDRAEGVADEAMRHAISKLANLHLAATAESAKRLARMGEREELIRVVGSPALDGLAEIPEMGDARAEEMGDPSAVFLLHPIGRADEHEERVAAEALEATRAACGRVLALHPNFDPGRAGVLIAIGAAIGSVGGGVGGVRAEAHLRRHEFVGLLKRLARKAREAHGAQSGSAARGGVVVGNSSAGLIECAALGVPVVDIGSRQAGRERAGNVVHAEEHGEAVLRAIGVARGLRLAEMEHPFGDGRAGERVAAALAQVSPHDPGLMRKRNVY